MDKITSKVPLIWVVGEREAEEKTVAIRRLGGKSQDVMSLEEALADVVDAAATPLDASFERVANAT